MKPGQILRRWWQKMVWGEYASHHEMYRDALAECCADAERHSRFFGPPPESKRFQAPERLAAPAFMKTTPYLVQWDKADWQFTDIRLMRWAAVFIELARERNVPLYVHCAYRSRAEQGKLVAAGRSKAAWPKSAHNIGEAVDIVHGVFHWEMTRDEWRWLHVLGQEALRRVNAELPKDRKLKLTWGGSWRFYDPAHWEIEDYRARTREVREGPAIRWTPRAILRAVRL